MLLTDGREFFQEERDKLLAERFPDGKKPTPEQRKDINREAHANAAVRDRGKSIKPKEKRTLGSLAELAVGREAKPAKIVQWVAANIELPVDKIDPDSVPSPEAVGLLTFAKTAGGGKDFWTIWARLLPTKSEVDRVDRFADDGRDLDHLFDSFEHAEPGGSGDRDQEEPGADAVLPERAEGIASEPELPA